MIKLLEKKCKFIITGATGFIGSRLCQELLADGHHITALTRSKNKISNQKNLIYINNINDQEFNYDVVINLAGAPISVYWTNNNRNEIYQSRIKTTRQIVEKILTAKNPPRLLISGSAIGYYGTSNKIIFNEDSSSTNQNLFSQKLCKDWENEALKAKSKTRVILLRTGVVVGNNGGIIKKMSLPFKIGLGGFMGDGSQIMSWIHIDDVIGILNLILNNNNLKGPFNLCAPQSCSNAEFSKILAKKYCRPCIFHMPKIIVKTLFGEMAEELLLASQKVNPNKAIKNNYDFKYPTISKAINSLIPSCD